jgi:hypothetical protein
MTQCVLPNNQLDTSVHLLLWLSTAVMTDMLLWLQLLLRLTHYLLWVCTTVCMHFTRAVLLPHRCTTSVARWLLCSSRICKQHPISPSTCYPATHSCACMACCTRCAAQQQHVSITCCARCAAQQQHVKNGAVSTIDRPAHLQTTTSSHHAPC